MMTFADELRNALETEPVLDSDHQERVPKKRAPVDKAGDDVRVFERDEPEALEAVLALNTEKEVWASDVWQDIVSVRHDHPDQTEQRAAWLALDDAAKFAYHVQQKAPDAPNAAWWIGYRGGRPAHARLLDRSVGPQEVWVQWVVGSQVFTQGSHSLVEALWDIGVRRVCFKSLMTHPLLNKWERDERFQVRPSEVWERHHPGHYAVVSFDMPDRPDFKGAY